MSFASDQILERLRLKRRLRLWQTLAVVAVMVVCLAVGAKLNVVGQGDHIARLWVTGVIRDNTLRDQQVAALRDDPKVKAVVVRINSPGGTVVGGEALYKNLRKLAEKKPVVAVMGELATSAGYMTAIGADYIVAREGTITGSIGVIMQSANLTKLMDKIGVEPVVIKSAPLKAAPNPMEEMTPQVREATQQIVMDMYDMFIEMVALRRNLKVDEVRGLADGRIFTGRQALGANLIDANGSEEKALGWLHQVKEIPKGLKILDVHSDERSFLARAKGMVFSTLLDKSLISEGLNLDGLTSVWHPSLQ